MVSLQQKAWQKQFEKGVCFSSHVRLQSIMTIMTWELWQDALRRSWDIRPYCTQGKEAERDTCWFDLLFIVARTPTSPWDGVTHTWDESSVFNELKLKTEQEDIDVCFLVHYRSSLIDHQECQEDQQLTHSSCNVQKKTERPRDLFLLWSFI